MTETEKETGHRLYVFIKKKNNSLLSKMQDNSALPRHDMWTVPLTVLTLSNYKHDVYTMMITNFVQEFWYSFD